MAFISSWQFMGWPASWSTLAAASRALSLSDGDASLVVLADFVLVPGFLALGFLLRRASPTAGGRLVQRSLRPLAGTSATAAGVVVSALSAGTLVVWVASVLVLTLAMLIS